MSKNKDKKIKVRDLNPKKDAKGGKGNQGSSLGGSSLGGSSLGGSSLGGSSLTGTGTGKGNT